MAPFRVSLTIPFLLALVASQTLAEEPFRYPEARHGKGELKYVNGVPVLRMEGSPAEVGEQLGVLALKPARRLLEISDKFLEANGWKKIFTITLKTGNLMLPQFPPDHVKELEAAARASGWSRDLLVFGNTVTDLRRILQCSALLVEAKRSSTGGPLFGRNLDWPPFGPLHEYTLVAVYRVKGKRAFASITYPGLLGCPSGMNDAGLALAALDVSSASDGSAKVNLRGTPTYLALRRVLEECTTIKEAERLLRSVRPASMLNVALCDRNGAAVFEITPKSLVVRSPVEGICACTNHFRSKQLATSTQCPRYDLLDASRKAKTLAVSDVARKMHAVNQGAATLQTMVFEPKTQKLHLAFGKGPATRLPLHTLDLKRLFKEGFRAKSVK
jgi:isopenicillin-N N-acyltransferase-like protein